MSVTIPENRVLPKKQKEIFTTLHTYYEKKDYGNGLKCANLILDKFPHHGETLAMKGLMLHSKGEKEEGYKLVKLGVKNDIQSHVCWHVFGLLHRADNNMKESSKCYLNALRLDPNNSLILRDLSWLQIQLRDYQSYCESRRRLLVLRPSIKANWVAFIGASFLAGNYEGTMDMIGKCRQAWPSSPSSQYEDSELILFQNRCYEKMGLFKEARQHLTENEAVIVDKFQVASKLAEFLLLESNLTSAREKYLSILQLHGENYRFHAGLQCAVLELDGKACLEMLSLTKLELPSNVLPLTNDQITKLRSLYSEEESFKGSRAATKILLELTIRSGASFRKELDDFMRKRIIEAVPSLYQDIKSLCRMNNLFNASSSSSSALPLCYVADPYDFKTHPVVLLAEELCDGHLRSLRASEKLNEEDETLAPPSALLWTLYLKSALLEMRGSYAEALSVIEEGIVHTPTAPDMLCRKAKLLRKCGDYYAAAVFMEAARRIDLQDRFLNNKATKYFLRADMVPDAEQTIALFTKHDGDPQKMLFDMQCCWYENLAGEAFMRVHDLGRALKKFIATEKHFLDHLDDFFDFHQFCIRKV